MWQRGSITDSGSKAETEKSRKGNSITWNLTGTSFSDKISIWSSLKMKICLHITYWQGSCQFCFLSCTDKILETDSLAIIFPRPLFPSQPGNSHFRLLDLVYLIPQNIFLSLDSYIACGNHPHLWYGKIASVTFT